MLGAGWLSDLFLSFVFISVACSNIGYGVREKKKKVKRVGE